MYLSHAQISFKKFCCFFYDFTSFIYMEEKIIITRFQFTLQLQFNTFTNRYLFFYLFTIVHILDSFMNIRYSGRNNWTGAPHNNFNASSDHSVTNVKSSPLKSTHRKSQSHTFGTLFAGSNRLEGSCTAPCPLPYTVTRQMTGRDILLTR